MKPEFKLKNLQEFMLAAVSHQDGIAAGLHSPATQAAACGLGLDEIVLPSKTLSAAERLGIYADMYYWRLVDVLADEFSRTRAVVGPDTFVTLARDYLHQHPSQHPNLSQLGVGFPDYLRHEAPELEQRDFLADLADFELYCGLIFDAVEDASIDAAAVATIAVEDWDDVVLKMTATTRVLQQSYPIDAWIDAGCLVDALPEAAASWLLLYRQNLEVMRLPLGPAAGRCLAILQAGGTMMAAIEASAEIEDIHDQIAGWFRSWTSLGLFRSLGH